MRVRLAFNYRNSIGEWPEVRPPQLSQWLEEKGMEGKGRVGGRANARASKRASPGKGREADERRKAAPTRAIGRERSGAKSRVRSAKWTPI